VGAGSTLVGYLPNFADDVLADRRRAVGVVGAIVDLFDKHRELDFDPNSTASGGFFSFLDALVLPEQDALFDVGIDLPAVGGMGFPQVDQEEFHLIFVMDVD